MKLKVCVVEAKHLKQCQPGNLQAYQKWTFSIFKDQMLQFLMCFCTITSLQVLSRISNVLTEALKEYRRIFSALIRYTSWVQVAWEMPIVHDCILGMVVPSALYHVLNYAQRFPETCGIIICSPKSKIFATQPQSKHSLRPNQQSCQLWCPAKHGRKPWLYQ